MMKEFVVATHARAAEAGAAGGSGLTKRAQMLLELVVDVKNNRCGSRWWCRRKKENKKERIRPWAWVEDAGWC